VELVRHRLHAEEARHRPGSHAHPADAPQKAASTTGYADVASAELTSAELGSLESDSVEPDSTELGLVESGLGWAEVPAATADLARALGSPS
jgi:hypothetical protein